MIDEKSIQQILDRANIVDVISQYVPLKKKGSTLEACCPLHEEKTPSFKVFPAKGTFHCFGCGVGGNVIHFLRAKEGYSFPEAVKVLAKRYGVKLEEEQKDPAAEQKQLMRDSMYAANEQCLSHFIDNLSRPEAKAALDYIHARWGKEYSQEMGIGFAMDSFDDLSRFANQKGLAISVLRDVGLVRTGRNNQPYDFFRNRIIIPIRDRYRHIIAFTARDMSGGKDGAAKYINSIDSVIYHKSETLFGVDVAVRTAIKDDKLYLVEGAPDVMQLQRLQVLGAVAPLGGSVTEGQLRYIKRFCQRICIIPDQDPPKQGEKYGAGVKSAIKNGQRAMQAGFSVTIKEIPRPADGSKADPGSYFTTKKVFDAVKEEDFIIWFAGIRFEGRETTEDKSQAMEEICGMLMLLDDEVKESMFLTRLEEIYKDSKAWAGYMARAKKAAATSSTTTGGKKIDKELYERYGFYEEGCSYYSLVAGSGATTRWSNFTMKPLFHIKDNIQPKRLYSIRNEADHEEIIEMKPEDLVALWKFKQKVEGLGNYIWLAGDKELTKLKMFLFEQTETATEIKQLGWQRQGFFAFGNGCYGTEWHPADEYGIVRMPDGNFYLPSSSSIYRDDHQLFQFERRFVHSNRSAVSLNEFSAMLIQVFGDNAKVALCFYFATLFKDIIAGLTKSFPILNLFGPKGSGKTELGHSLMSFFIVKNTPPNIQNATLAALSDAVAQCSNALVHIDEYKNSIDLDKREFLKGLWDGAGRNRMNMDKDKKREMTAVDCGVILSGQEMPTIDIALFSRLIYLTFKQDTFSAKEKRAFDECKAVRDLGLSHITLALLRQRARMETGFSGCYTQCMKDLNDLAEKENVEDRILRNWLIPLAAFRCLEPVIEVPFNYRDILKITREGILRQNKECKNNNELSFFWNLVSYMMQDGNIFINADYRIDYVTRFKSSMTEAEMIFPTRKPILMLRKNRVFTLYKKITKQSGENSLPSGSLKYYLENSKEYMGLKNAVRFKNIQRGEEVMIPITTATGGKEMKASSTVEQALCFDYEMIMKNYSINLEVDVDKEEKEGREEREGNEDKGGLSQLKDALPFIPLPNDAKALPF